ncbi:hypothetical protein HNY73_009085 [Argiope bruennichi]|uniref:Uncharacterized protein n=1 Tax=Argiope bruennichi TaxID=94029 RepID=A0A8T0F8F6_ARGBR|nr:hypothetical protein HNY73_009085 [Argiope bruennichi]
MAANDARSGIDILPAALPLQASTQMWIWMIERSSNESLLNEVELSSERVRICSKGIYERVRWIRLVKFKGASLVRVGDILWKPLEILGDGEEWSLPDTNTIPSKSVKSLIKMITVRVANSFIVKKYLVTHTYDIYVSMAHLAHTYSTFR